MGICDCAWENQSCLHNNWNPIDSLTLKLHSSTVLAHQACVYINSLVCFHWRLFLKPGKPWKYTTRPVEPVNGINEGVCGAKLFPMSVVAYPVDCDCLCHLLDTHYCCLCLNSSFNPPSASHLLPPPPAPFHPPTPLYKWYYSHCEKSCSKSSSVS